MNNEQIKALKNSILLNIDTNILDENNLIKKNKLSKETTKQLFINLFIKVDCKVNYEVLKDNNIIVDFGNNIIKFLSDKNLKRWQLVDKFKNLIRHNGDIVNCKYDEKTNNLDYYFSYGNNLRNKLNININLSLFCKKYFNLFMNYLSDIESINNRQDKRKIISNIELQALISSLVKE